MSLDEPPFGHRAIWPSAPEYRNSCPLPLLVRPQVAGSHQVVATRALRRPLSVARALLRGGSLGEIAGALLLQDTVVALGYTEFVDAEGRPHELRALMNGGRRKELLPKPARVGAVIIAQDEERILSHALTSLEGLASDIVVVDGGSQDGTRALAQSLGARVIDRQFGGDFAAQRNAGLDAVNTDWVITLDADETVSPALKDLLGLLLNQDLRVDAVCVPRLNHVGDSPEPILWPDVQPRVFRPHLRYKGRVHEQLAWRRAVLLPANGPYIVHTKTTLRHCTNSLRYSTIDASPYSDADLEWFRRETARLTASETNITQEYR